MSLLWIGSGLLASFVALVAYLYAFGSKESRSDNSVEVAASARRAFDVFADFSRWPRIWQRIGAVSPPAEPVEVGATFSFTQPQGQRVDAKVLRWDRGACIQLELDFAASRPRERFTMRFEPVEPGRAAACLVTMVNELRVDQARDRVLVPLTRPAANLFARGVLWRLKIEAEAED
jgi:hypothetical protein